MLNTPKASTNCGKKEDTPAGEQKKRFLSSPDGENIQANKKKAVDTSNSNMDVESHNEEEDFEGDATTSENEDQANEPKYKCNCCVDFEKILGTIHAELAEIRKQNTEREKDRAIFEDLKENVDFLNKKYDDHLKEIKDLKSENMNLKEQIKEQNQRIDDIDQYGRRMNVLFDGIKEEKKEDTTELVIEQCQKLGINITTQDIQVTHRVGKNNNKKTRPVIARFASVKTAITILQTVKNQFRETDTNTTKTNKPVVNAREHLTNSRALLLKECLTKKKAGKLSKCWIYRYELYVKKKKDDPAGVRITCMEDLIALGL
jgi:hypothetical protein